MREYEDRAVALAGGGRKGALGRARAWLLRGRGGSALFDAALWVRELERRLAMAWELHRSGTKPRHLM